MPLSLFLSAPNDYDRILNRVFQFTPDTTSLSVFVPIVDDDDIEDVERFLANLEINEEIFPEVTLDPTPATVDIISNDGINMCVYVWSAYTVTS